MLSVFFCSGNLRSQLARKIINVLTCSYTLSQFCYCKLSPKPIASQVIKVNIPSILRHMEQVVPQFSQPKDKWEDVNFIMDEMVWIFRTVSN